MKLKDVIEDIDDNPRAGDTLEMLKKELRRMKAVKICEEPFTNTYYVQNTEDRSRRGKWDAKKFVRSNSRPGYFRTGSKNMYMRDNSRFSRQGSSFRYASKSRQGSKTGSGSIPRGSSKSSERLKSEMFKKVEKIEKKNEEFEKSLNEIKEMLKTINT